MCAFLLHCVSSPPSPLPPQIIVHPDMPSQVKQAYLLFMVNAYIDTEVAVREVLASTDVWAVLDAVAVDMQRFADVQYNLAQPSFNEYVTGTAMTAVRHFVHKLGETEYVPPPGPRCKSLFQLISSMCAVAHRVAEVSVCNR